ncbi:MAG: DUF2314 domain-containing protein [Myxococcaceae bacterium]
MKVVYIVATERETAVPLSALKETLASDELKIEAFETEGSFRLESDAAAVEARYETMDAALGWTPDLITGSEAAHQVLRKAKSIYRISIEPGGAQPSMPVFEGLWCARALLEHVEGVVLDVTSYKLHEPADVEEITELDFDIRDHINLHAVEAREGEANLWVHSHGMEKFGIRDVEAFHLQEEDLPAAESFFHQLCTDMAFGQGPKARSLVETGEGDAFMLVPAEEARPKLIGVELETFEGHEGLFYTVVAPDGRHTIVDILKPYRGRFGGEPPERTQALLQQAQAMMPSFKARFQRKGLMEPLQFLVRARFETHPDEEAVDEDLWAEVLSWEEGTVLGKLIDGSSHTTEWRKGVQVEIDEEQVNAIAINREGRTLDEEEMGALLTAERPS